MKRVALALAVLLVAGLAAGVALAAPNDVRGPKCADIIDGDPYYSGTTAGAYIYLAAASCKNITYTLYVLDEESGNIYTTSMVGDGSSTAGQFILELSTAVTSDADGNVCIWAETSNKGRVLDRAPDEGCIPVRKDTPPGRSGFN